MFFSHAEDPEYPSPYIQEALDQGMDLPWWEKLANLKVVDGQLQLGKLSGGKQDDITVLVARITEQEVPEEQQETAAPAEPVTDA